MDNPIWKPYQISIGLEASQSVLFRVGLGQNPGGQILFTGRAYAKTPDAGEVKVVLNDVFANYVSMPFPQIVAGVHQFSKGGTRGFFVEAQENGQNWSAVKSVFFNPDWSYDDAKAWVDGKPLTAVAGRQVSANQYLFITVVECFGVKIHGTRKDGSTYVVSSTLFTTESTGTAAFRLSDFASEGDVLQVYCVADGSDFNMDFSDAFGGEGFGLRGWRVLSIYLTLGERARWMDADTFGRCEVGARYRADTSGRRGIRGGHSQRNNKEGDALLSADVRRRECRLCGCGQQHECRAL